MNLQQKVSRANPDQHRFRVKREIDRVAIVDYSTGFAYSLFQNDCGNWVVCLQGTSEAWVYPSLRKLLLFVWDEIIADAERMFTGF